MSVYVYFSCGVHICLSYSAVVFPLQQRSWSSKAHMDTGWLHVNVISLSELLTERMLKLNILSDLTRSLAIFAVLWYRHRCHSYIHKHSLAPWESDTNRSLFWVSVCATCSWWCHGGVWLVVSFAVRHSLPDANQMIPESFGSPAEDVIHSSQSRGHKSSHLGWHIYMWKHVTWTHKVL